LQEIDLLHMRVLNQLLVRPVFMLFDMVDCFTECWCNYWQRWFKHKQTKTSCKCSLLVCCL